MSGLDFRQAQLNARFKSAHELLRRGFPSSLRDSQDNAEEILRAMVQLMHQHLDLLLVRLPIPRDIVGIKSGMRFCFGCSYTLDRSFPNRCRVFEILRSSAK